MFGRELVLTDFLVVTLSVAIDLRLFPRAGSLISSKELNDELVMPEAIIDVYIKRRAISSEKIFILFYTVRRQTL